MPSSSGYFSALWCRITVAVRTYAVAGLILQALLALVILGYYFLPPVHGVLETAAVWKMHYGLAYSVFSTAFFGGVVPFLVRRVMGEAKESLTFDIAFWVLTGIVVDLLYRSQISMFGAETTVAVVARKLAFDQLLAGPIMLTIQTAAVEWRDRGYRVTETWRILGPRWYAQRVVPVQLTCFMIWPPAVAVIYSLKPALQIPVVNLVQCFWALIFFFMARREAAHEAKPALERNSRVIALREERP